MSQGCHTPKWWKSCRQNGGGWKWLLPFGRGPSIGCSYRNSLLQRVCFMLKIRKSHFHTCPGASQPFSYQHLFSAGGLQSANKPVKSCRWKVSRNLTFTLLSSVSKSKTCEKKMSAIFDEKVPRGNKRAAWAAVSRQSKKPKNHGNARFTSRIPKFKHESFPTHTKAQIMVQALPM